MAVTKNQEYTVTVEGYSGEGAGVARIDGFVVFVSGALRGEVGRAIGDHSPDRWLTIVFTTNAEWVD